MCKSLIFIILWNIYIGTKKKKKSRVRNNYNNMLLSYKITPVVQYNYYKMFSTFYKKKNNNIRI